MMLIFVYTCMYRILLSYGGIKIKACAGPNS